MMNPVVPFVSKLLAFLALFSDIGIVVFILLFALSGQNPVVRFLGKNGRIFAFIVALTATLGSLFYSEIAGFEPCKLCWYQRIFMYPQVFLLGLSIWKNDKIADYIMGLSFAGAGIAGYHYYLQRGGVAFLPCSTVGYSVSCAKNFVMEFGYITIPLMSLTAFLMIIIFMWLTKKQTSSRK